MLADVEPDNAVAAARVELAGELLDDLRRVDGQIARVEEAAQGRWSLRRAPPSSDIFGVGPVVAATVVGITGDIARFPSRDHFAAFNGTAPIEVSSGGRKVWRLSRRGNRTLNHAIHMAAVTQVRFRHSPGRAYYDRKIAEGKTPQGSAARSQAPHQRRAVGRHGRRRHDGVAATTIERRAREGNRGTTLSPARPAHTPNTGSSAKPLPNPTQGYDHRPNTPRPRRRERRLPPEELLDNQRGLDLGA